MKYGRKFLERDSGKVEQWGDLGRMTCKWWRRRKQGDLRTEDRMVKEDPV
jgi:hypothetical protein